MITWEELEKIEQECAMAKGSPVGMRLIEAGLIEKLVAEIKHLHELMIYIHALFVPDDGLTNTAWAALMVLSDNLLKGMRPKDLIMGATKKFYDDWMIRNQPSEKGETVFMCDPRELGVIFDQPIKKTKPKKGKSKGGLCSRRK